MPQNLKTEWSVQLYDGRLQVPITDDTAIVRACVAGSGRSSTLYSDALGTAITQPMTMRGGRVRFFTDSSITTLTLTLLTARGYAFIIPDLVPSNQRVVVWPDDQSSWLGLPYDLVANAVSATVVDTGFKLPANVLVTDVYVDVLEASTLGALAVGLNAGTSGTATGFVALVLTSTTGLQILSSTVSLQVGTLLAGATTNTYFKTKYKGIATSNLTYTTPATAYTVGSGFIYLKLERVPTRQA